VFSDDVRPLFFDILEATEFLRKQALRALERTIDCWTATTDREAILEYEELNTSPFGR
jgi:hypothetical protein